MDLFSQSPEGGAGQSGICHYQLDFQQNGNNHYYVWRYHRPEEADQKKIAMLIDLNNVHVPNFEIEKLVGCFLIPTTGVVSIAFANCHAHNQQDIKRRLKAGDVKLYSRTAFFTDAGQALHWLREQCVSC